MKPYRLLMLVAVLVVTLGLTAAVCACNVPVFRFALERWRADAYRVVVFHRGPLSEAERTLLRPFEKQQDRLLANVIVRSVNVDDVDAENSPDATADRDFLRHLRNPQFPCLVVQYPADSEIDAPLWIGPLEREAIAELIDSPARKELIRRLAAGETTVWILLESGDLEKDNQAAQLLAAELKNLEQTLKLPVLTASPDDALNTQLPLQVKFSLLRVPRGQGEEKMLVSVLLGSEPDLAELTDPMVFPVFGRGRGLLPLVGAGITARNIGDAAEFLAGACSCEVKEQNPGFDLLLAADWEVLLSPTGIPLAAASDARTKTVTAGEPAEPVIVPIPKGSSRAHAAAVEPSPGTQSNNPANSELSASYFGIAAGCAAMIGILGIALVAAVARVRRIS